MRLALKIVSLLSRATRTRAGFDVSQLAKAAAANFGKPGYAKELIAYKLPEPSTYRCADLLRRESQCIGLYKKLAGLDVGVDLHREAIKTYKECEVQNQGTNRRLALYINWFERGFVGDHHDLRLYDTLVGIRRIVADLLGPLPQYLIPSFSGGSTFYDKGEKITIPHKLDSTLAVTAGARSICLKFLAETLWGKAHYSAWTCQNVEGNRFTSVPKDSTKNRGICIEPLLNVAFQLPVGKYIRERYKLYAGVEINGECNRNAQVVHRELARYASRERTLATIDLSNASDLISIALVKLLLPKGWFDLLNALRSPSTFIEGTWVKNHKFSSMGNGFTFELESVLFYSIARYVCGWASAYGDDMIVNSSKAVDLFSALRFFGLTVNKAKTFYRHDDPFRESCGGDFFDGAPVRPYFFKEAPADPLAWTELHNTIWRLRHEGLFAHCREVEEALQCCINEIPVSFRAYGPPGTGGTLWTLSPKRYNIRTTRVCGIEDPNQLEIRKLEPVNKRLSLSRFRSDIQLAAALLSCPSTGVVPRDSVIGYRRVWRPFLG